MRRSRDVATDDAGIAEAIGQELDEIGMFIQGQADDEADDGIGGGWPDGLDGGYGDYAGGYGDDYAGGYGDDYAGSYGQPSPAPPGGKATDIGAGDPPADGFWGTHGHDGAEEDRPGGHDGQQGLFTPAPARSPRPHVAERPPRRWQSKHPEVNVIPDDPSSIDTGRQGRRALAKEMRRGMLSSGIALVLALAALGVAWVPFAMLRQASGSFPIALVSALPTVATLCAASTLFALRSYSAPRGALGRGRAFGSQVLVAVALACAAFCTSWCARTALSSSYGSGIVAKEQLDDGGMAVVFPGGRIELGQEAADRLMRAGLLPRGTVSGGRIPVSAGSGTIYMGSGGLGVELVGGSSSGGAAKLPDIDLLALMEGAGKDGWTYTADAISGMVSTVRDPQGHMATVTRVDGGWSIAWSDDAFDIDGLLRAIGIDAQQGE